MLKTGLRAAAYSRWKLKIRSPTVMNKMLKIHVLLIEDEEFDVRRIEKTINLDGKIEISNVVSDGQAAVSNISADPEAYDVVIMDFQIAGGLMGENLIAEIKKINSCIQVIVVTKMTLNISDYNFANKLIEAGAFWYCTKYPAHFTDHIYQPTDFIMSIKNAYDKKELEKEKLESNLKFMKTVDSMLNRKRIVGESAGTQALRDIILKYAKSDFNVLITGDSGTGKELVANNIHFISPRKFENFVPINCGSLPEELIESELFGYEKGAFTGAVSSKQGLFEMANKGTVFLDEVSELPHTAQVKLLRVIQEGEIEKIGRNRKIEVDVRIIAATNKDLLKEVDENRFRKDLYYRLNILPVQVPSLKERKDDILPLFRHFLNICGKSLGKIEPEISVEAEKILAEYDWPGNIRELKSVAQRMLILDEGLIGITSARNAIGRSPAKNTNPQSVDYLFDTEDIHLLKNAEMIFRDKYIRFVRKNSSSDADAALKLGVAPSNYFRLGKQIGFK
jgi:DNA-binding NtrC family response regulator